MGGSIRKEIKLAKRLQDLCDDGGKELNSEQSANILNDFGLLYKEKSPDKISLIQSAAFLNAAIIRQTSNDQFQNNLQDLCSHVLKVAKATQLQADLCAISDEAWKMVKEMRNHSKATLSQLQNIPLGLSNEQLRKLEIEVVNHVRNLQNELTQNYVKLMDFIGKQSIEIMGSPPCRYSFTAMGSLARKEITPFSDFEHVILLEEGVQHKDNYDKILEYFRWVSVIFHIIVINLKETVLKAVAIPWLNDDTITGGDWFFDSQTPYGIKFDGMQLAACKIPLGRTRQHTVNKPFTVELIKPASEMAKYLELEEDIKNGYHLADVLTKTCFVSGNKEVHEDFVDLVKKVLSSEKSYLNDFILEDIKNYFKVFDALTCSTKEPPTFDIKRLLYRTSTLFISALGRLQSADDYSCFEIIDHLNRKQLICEETKHKFLYMVAISCSARLTFYFLNNAQDDIFDTRQINFENGKEAVHARLSDVMGGQMIGDYLIIASMLQTAMRKEVIFPLAWQALSLKPSIKFTILTSCLLYERILFEWEKYLKLGIREDFEDDNTIRYIVAGAFQNTRKHQEALNLYIELEPALKPHMKSQAIAGIGQCLCRLERFKEMIDYSTQSKEKVKSICLPLNQRNHVLGKLATLESRCKKKLCLYNEAITSYSEALKYFSDSDFHIKGMLCENIATCHHEIGQCQVKLGKHMEAVESISKALKMLLKGHPSSGLLFSCYMSLGSCYLTLANFPIAKRNFEEAINLRYRLDPNVDEEKDYVIKLCQNSINLINMLNPIKDN